ncbi:MAG: hypothetical protein AAFO95_14275 [Cyanobacteria bacterium J06600_6]
MPSRDRQPKQVLLFSGHMIDRRDRPQPRFPPQMEQEVKAKIQVILDQLDASAQDLAIAPGIACGGDILFLEACLQRQIPIVVYLPFEPDEFIAQSVSFAGNNWVERFAQIESHALVTVNLQPKVLGQLPAGENPYERNNLWALESSSIYGSERIRLIVLWDGQGGDGQGGTFDMVERVRQLGGTVNHLNTTKFDYWQKVDLARSGE